MWKDEYRMKPNRGSLTIYGVTEKDAGNYTVAMTNKITKEEQRRTFRLLVNGSESLSSLLSLSLSLSLLFSSLSSSLLLFSSFSSLSSSLLFSSLPSLSSLLSSLLFSSLLFLFSSLLFSSLLFSSLSLSSPLLSPLSPLLSISVLTCVLYVQFTLRSLRRKCRWIEMFTCTAVALHSDAQLAEDPVLSQFNGSGCPERTAQSDFCKSYVTWFDAVFWFASNVTCVIQPRM